MLTDSKVYVEIYRTYRCQTENFISNLQLLAINYSLEYDDIPLPGYWLYLVMVTLQQSMTSSRTLRARSTAFFVLNISMPS